MAYDKNLLGRDFKEFVATADAIFETYHKRAQNPSVAITKFSIYLAEIYQELGRNKEASDIFIKLATILPNKHPSKPLFFEQAAYEFLVMRQFRKFAFYM